MEPKTIHEQLNYAKITIATIISELCKSTGLSIASLSLNYKPDFQNGGKIWDGTVHLTFEG